MYSNVSTTCVKLQYYTITLSIEAQLINHSNI